MAHKFLGITYTWGGVSSFGFDCSGFTQMLERQRGIEMPRDADLQAAWSGVIPVEREDLQPGDLLFFGASAAKITHTGMYLGNGEFIHDTTHDHPGVQISRLDDSPGRNCWWPHGELSDESKTELGRKIARLFENCRSAAGVRSVPRQRGRIERRSRHS